MTATNQGGFRQTTKEQTMAPEAAVEETEEEGGPRSQMWKHEAMVEWLNEQNDIDLNECDAATIIAYAFAQRVAWRKSETYQNLVAGRQEQVAKEQAERKAEREKAAAERKAAKEAEKAAKAEAAEKAAPTPAKATKATKAKTAPAKATRAGKKDASTGENPFG